jgi:predicted GNAT superfamily acetyltransferase
MELHPRSVTISPVATIEECRAIEKLQAAVWGPAGVVPDHLLITVAKNGGVVLLARDGDRPVGFCFSFPGLTPDGTVKHCSHMAAVLPDYQNENLGARLKWAQRAAVLAQGPDHVTWTYDPLEARNAYFNLRKLGAVCRRYRRNVYGLVDDVLNQGLATDRFEVDWWLDSPRVQERAAGAGVDSSDASPVPPVINPADWRSDGHPAPRDDFRLPATPRCRVEIPTDFQALKKSDLALAHAWREQTRFIFEEAFGRGYVVTDLARKSGRSHYLLEKHFLVGY